MSMINSPSVEQVIEATCPQQTDIRTGKKIVFECVQLYIYGFRPTVFSEEAIIIMYITIYSLRGRIWAEGLKNKK